MKWQAIINSLFRSCVAALLCLACSLPAFADSAEDSLEAILTESTDEEFQGHADKDRPLLDERQTVRRGERAEVRDRPRAHEHITDQIVELTSQDLDRVLP